MNLHENTEAFKQFVNATATQAGLLNFQVEKDYYVSLLLKKLSLIENNVSIVFKGGTSLSKCYDIIDRFSEDIDLAIHFPDKKPGDGLRKRLKNGILAAINDLGFELINADEIQSDKDFNKYLVRYPKLFPTEDHMVPDIIIETLVVFKPFPCEKKKVSNYITKFLEKESSQYIEPFELEPFEMEIQTIDRTFVDKLFAICDYHIQEKYDRYSRHIYDIHKIWNSGYLNLPQLNTLIESVAEQRQLIGTSTYSCVGGAKPNAILQEIIDKNVYKNDYEKVTLNFLYNEVSYEESIASLKEIVELKLLPELIPTYSNTGV